MKMRFLVTGAVAAMMLAAPAFAATIKFDTFQDEQTASGKPNPAVNPTGDKSTVVAGPTSGFIGTSRDFTVVNTKRAAVSKFNGTSLTSGDGVLSFDNNTSARGLATLTYNGIGSALMGANLLSNAAFVFNILEFDGGARFSFAAEDFAGRTLSYGEDLGVSGSFSNILTFSQIVDYSTAAGNAGAGAFDFSGVKSLSFMIDNSKTANSVDGALTGIDVTYDDMSPVPLPASGLLLVGGFGALAGLRRRKARKIVSAV